MAPKQDDPSTHLKQRWAGARDEDSRREIALSLLSWTQMNLAWAEAEVKRREGPVREAVAMCADSGVTYAAMAEVLGVADATVHRRFGPGSGS